MGGKCSGNIAKTFVYFFAHKKTTQKGVTNLMLTITY